MKLTEEHQRLLGGLLESVHDVIWTATIEGKLVYANPAVEQISGHSISDFLKNPSLWSDIIHPDDRAEAQYHTGLLLERGQIELEYRIIHPNGEIRWLLDRRNVIYDEAGQPAGIGGIATDITGRKQLEQALQQQTEILQTIIDNIPIMISFFDAEVRFLLVNRAWEETLGWRFEEVKDRTDMLTRFFPDPEYRQSILHTMMTAEPGWHEQRLTVRDGRVIKAVWANVRLSDGTMIGIGQDISDLKQMEERLYQAQKMESIGRLAGGIAHDFNNLLVPIIGYVELGMMSLAADSKLYADLAQVKKAADRAADLVRQILAFSRQQVMEMRVVNLNEIVGEFEQMIHRLIGEDIELRTYLDPALHRVKADKAQIEQVLMNLVVNARDAMPEGGKLTLETANVFLDETYIKRYASNRSPGQYIMLTVGDTGHGMDARTRQRIFDPFFTTKEQGKGTGLGLATVFGIVKQHQGSIWVYSEPGGGTTFKIYLPQAEDSAKGANATVTEPASFYGTETVLVVEDEEMVRKLVCETLQAQGYRIIEAQNPADALQFAANYRDKIDLLLTDVIMPGMNGRNLYQQVSTTRPQLKVLYMSGYTDNVIVHHGLLHKGVNFLQKPFTVHALMRKVRLALIS